MPLFYKNRIRKSFLFIQSIGYSELKGDYKKIYYTDPIICFSNGIRKICFYYDNRENRFSIIIRNGSKIEDISNEAITLSDFLNSNGETENAEKVSNLDKYSFKQILEQSALYLNKYKMDLNL